MIYGTEQNVLIFIILKDSLKDIMAKVYACVFMYVYVYMYVYMTQLDVVALQRQEN